MRARFMQESTQFAAIIKMAYSLWLKPPIPSPVHTFSTEQIKRLSTAHKSPVFDAHVTLLGGFGDGLAEDEVLRRSKELARELSRPGQPFERGAEISVSHVESGSIFFQCVYLRMRDDPRLSAAFAATCAKFGEDPAARRFMPHLSLIYSDIPQEERRAIVDEVTPLAEAALGLGAGAQQGAFVSTSLSLWRTEVGDKSLQSWVQLAEMTIGAGGEAS